MYFGKSKNSGEYGFDVFTENFESYIEVDDETHISIIRRATDEQKLISADEEGNPILVDRPEPSDKEKTRRRISELESYLTSTDWYVIRFADTGEEIPADIKTKRQEARDEISRLREKYSDN